MSIKQFMLAAAAATATALAAVNSVSLEPRALNPFDTIDRVQIEVTVGETIGNAPGERLFAHDRARAQVFSDRLKARIESLLRSRGFQPDSGSDDSVLVGIWGHQVPRPDGCIDNVFLISLYVTDMDWDPAAEADCQRDFTQQRDAIGVASDDQLEEVLTEEAMRLLEEELPIR